MAMTAAGLAASITSAQGPAEDTAKQDAANLAIATGIINYITANAVVTVPAGVAVATTGGPAAQTGATTAPGTGTIS